MFVEGCVENHTIFSCENVCAVIYKNAAIVGKLVESTARNSAAAEDDSLASTLHRVTDFTPSGDKFTSVISCAGAKVDISSGSKFTLICRTNVDYETVSYSKRTHGDIFLVLRSYMKQKAPSMCTALILMQANGMVVCIAPKLYQIRPYFHRRGGCGAGGGGRGAGRGGGGGGGQQGQDNDKLVELNRHDGEGKYVFILDLPFTLSCIAQTICKAQGQTMLHVIVDTDGKPQNKLQDYVGASRAALSYQSTNNIATGGNLKQYIDSMSSFMKDTMLVV